MNLVRSEWYGDCGVCCAAMIAGQDRQHVEANVRLSYHEGTPYLSVPELAVYLAQQSLLLGCVFQIARPADLDTSADGVQITVPLSMDALLTVPGSSPGFWHYVVWSGDARRVYDPARSEPQLLGVYDSVIEWAVVNRPA